MSGHRIPFDLFLSQNKKIDDPGSGGTIKVKRDLGHVALVAAGSEARTLAVPLQANLRLLLYVKTLPSGTITLTITSGGDEANDTSFAFTATGQFLSLVSVEEGSNLRWRVVSSDGVTGGTTALGSLTVAGTAAVTGALSGSSSIKSSSASAGVGYATGAGAAVTQGTSRTTGVTINAVCGSITLVSAAGSATPFSFTVTNSAVAATDVIVVSQKSGTDKYTTQVVSAVAAGSFQLTLANASGTTTEQPVFNFAVIKSVAA